MDATRLELSLSSSFLGSKVTVPGAVSGRVLGISIDPSTKRIVQTVVTNRVATQLTMNPVDGELAGAVLLNHSTNIMLQQRKLGAISRIWADSATSIITHLLFKVGNTEHVIEAKHIESISEKQIILAADTPRNIPIYRDDSAIEAEVNHALDQAILDPRARRAIHARVEDAKVDLSGIVDANEYLEAIATATRNVPGVRGIQSDIIITESLATVVTRAIDELIAKGTLGENVEVTVLSEHQIIYLNGHVSTVKASTEAERAALGVNGVRIVVNTLRVEHPADTIRPDPESPITRNR